MISKILIASIRARLTEVTAPGRQREQPFLKLAQIHMLNIQSLFKKIKWMSHACSFQRHMKSSKSPEGASAWPQVLCTSPEDTTTS